MWYEAHYRNGLKITTLDEDLSPAQFAQLNEFLDKKGLYTLFISFFFNSSTTALQTSSLDT